MSQTQHCLINHNACGRVAGNHVCPKCGMDERDMFVGTADRELAVATATARYWQAHARHVEEQAKQTGASGASSSSGDATHKAAKATQSSQPAPSKATKRRWPRSLGTAVIVVALLGAVAFKYGNLSPGGALRAAVAEMASHPEVPEMAAIAAGSITLGSPDGEPERRANEGPQREVNVAPFELGLFEVTFDQWDACVSEGGCSHSPLDADGGRGNRPVVNVSWDDIAKEYLPWINRKTGKTFRLPTQDEWEFAARAGCAAPFNLAGACKGKVEAGQANFRWFNSYNGSETSFGTYPGQTLPVGSFSPNRLGLRDMHGNVSEWVQDCVGAVDAAATVECTGRVVRGGSWNDNPSELRAAYRLARDQAHRRNETGFRLARSVP